MKYYQVIVTKVTDSHIQHVELFKTDNINLCLNKSKDSKYEIKEISEEKYKFQKDMLKDSNTYF